MNHPVAVRAQHGKIHFGIELFNLSLEQRDRDQVMGLDKLPADLPIHIFEIEPTGLTFISVCFLSGLG